MMQGQMLKDLPLDAILNIQSFLIGKPNDLRLKNNKKLVELQRLFKINYGECRIHECLFGRSINSTCWITGERLNINIILNQTKRLGDMWVDTYNYYCTMTNFNPYGLIFESRLVVSVRVKNKFYREQFDIPEQTPDEIVHEFLNDAKMEIENQMKENNQKEIFYISLRVEFEF